MENTNQNTQNNSKIIKTIDKFIPTFNRKINNPPVSSKKEINFFRKTPLSSGLYSYVSQNLMSNTQKEEFNTDFIRKCNLFVLDKSKNFYNQYDKNYLKYSLEELRKYNGKPPKKEPMKFSRKENKVLTIRDFLIIMISFFYLWFFRQCKISLYKRI